MNVLAVACHPDDIEVNCAGTLIRYAKQGAKVCACHVASGSLGHVVIPPEELTRIRFAEAEHASRVEGVEHVSLGVPDLEVDSKNEAVVRELVDLIRRVQPDVIITHSEEDYMRDHVEVARMVFNASFSSSVAHYVTTHPAYAQIAPIFYMDTLAGFGPQPTEYVDISDEIEGKLQALACHESQIKWMLEHDHIDFVDFVRTCSKFRGLQCGVAYAEGFRPCLSWPRVATKRLLP